MIDNMLPDALLVGVSEDEFWKLTPRTFKIHVDTFKRMIERQDTQNWQLGAYFMRGCAVAIDHALNGQKAQSEYFEKPLHEMGEDDYIDASDWTEEQKEEYRMKLFGYLGDLQATHEAAEAQKKALVGSGS